MSEDARAIVAALAALDRTLFWVALNVAFLTMMAGCVAFKP
jgi:hypothetical protein